ncbi:MAG: host attachment protein [Sphingobium sp.]|nr:host attachment protein [Sphingobium sp.]
MRIDHDALVLVADGRKMLMLRNEGDAEYPNLQVEKVDEIDNPPTREQATHAAGQASSPMGQRQHSVEQTDFHQIEEDRFAVDTAIMLQKRALANEFEKIIIVAPPQTLGEMRKHYHGTVQERLVGEIAKDLVSHPVSEIEQIVKSA